VKILPTIPGWEELLQYLAPDQWTPNACFAVTKIFSSAKPSIAQRWMELVMLDRVRDDIYENKKLNVHLWAALKKSYVVPPPTISHCMRTNLDRDCTNHRLSSRDSSSLSSILVLAHYVRPI